MHALPPGSGWGGWPSNGNLKAAGGAPGSPSASAPRSPNSLAAAAAGGGGGSTMSGAPSLAGSQTGWMQQQQPIWGALVDDIEPLVSSGPSLVSQVGGVGGWVLLPGRGGGEGFGVWGGHVGPHLSLEAKAVDCCLRPVNGVCKSKHTSPGAPCASRDVQTCPCCCCCCYC
jgi:hypothetical protein